jgi:hypothetical protein
MATKPNVGLAHPWGQSDFARVQASGLSTMAFVSGWDDPLAVKSQGQAWGLSDKLCLDVEGGIRGDGSWVQGWLDTSRAGLYGNYGVHPNRTATFHILAAYPASGNPNATWYSNFPRPKGPCGWQWQGTHNEFGATVDRGWYDDWFAQGGPVDMAGEDSALVRLAYEIAEVLLNSGGMSQNQMNYGLGLVQSAGGDIGGPMGTIMDSSEEWGQVRSLMGEIRTNAAAVPALQAEVDQLKAQIAAGGTPSAPPDLSGVLAAITNVETALQALTAAVQAIK